MTPSQTMHSVQRFTADGKVGVALLLGSPLVSGASYAWLLAALNDPYNHNLFAPSALLILSGLAFIGGALAVLIGREQITTVTNIEAHKASDFTIENYTEQTNREARESRQTAELLDRCGTSPRPVWSAY